MPQTTLQDSTGNTHVPKTMVIGTHTLKGGTYFSPKSPWYQYIIQHATPEQKRLLGLGAMPKVPDFSVDVSADKQPPVAPSGGGGGGVLPPPVPGAAMPPQATGEPQGERGTVHVGAVDIRPGEDVPKDSPLYWYVMHHAKPEQLAELGLQPDQRPIAAQENDAASYAKHKKSFDKFPIGEVPVSPLIHAITGGEQVLQFSSEEFPVHVNPRLVTDYFRKIMGRRFSALPSHVRGAIARYKKSSNYVFNRLHEKWENGEDEFKSPKAEAYLSSVYNALEDAFDISCVGKPFVTYRAISRSVVGEMFNKSEIRGSEIVEIGFSNTTLSILTAAQPGHRDDVGLVLKLVVPARTHAVYTDLFAEKGETEILLMPHRGYLVADQLPTFLPHGNKFIPVYTAFCD